jgi:hypothetical protein
MENIQSSLARLKQDIRMAEAQYGRVPGSVALLAVSKLRPVADIRAAIAGGQLQFAENYAQEALEKIHLINDPGLIWHFIGPIQSNKTRPIAEHFHWVHSIDRLKTAQRLNDARPAHLPPLNICIQINISKEQTKAGIAPDELPEFIEKCRDLPKLRLRGLMTLPEPASDFEQQRLPFCLLKNLFNDLCRDCPGCDTLSMGTTQDMQAAIAEGSTMVRIGTALFGPRP